MKNQKKQILTICAGIILLILAISIISANQKVCITKGQNYPCPNPTKVCKTDYCYFCVNNNGCVTYDKNCPGNPICGSYNGTIDLTPPVLTVNSPVDNQIYNSRSVLFTLTTDEIASFFYKDNSDEGANWKKIASNVNSFIKSINLKNGLNDISIKAVDTRGNEVIIAKKFRLDTLKPKISKINPTKGFANGKFDVWFTEANAKTLVLNYGNNVTGRKTSNIDLNSCTDLGKGKYTCTTQISLNEYNGQNIDYSFRLTDIADSYVDSKLATLAVDISPPVINNPTSIITVNGKYVYFNMNITELNFKAVSYQDNSDGKWKKMCSSLKDGVCTKKVSFKTGNHILDIKVDDKAGNSAANQLEFNIL